MNVVRSVCPLDCPDRCGLSASIVNGQVVKLDSDPEEPGSYICAKVRRFPSLAVGPDRIARPLRRIGPRGVGRSSFVEISWSEALDEVERRIRAESATPAAVLPYWYGGSNGMLTGNSVDAWFFDRIAASDIERTLCAANTSAGAAAVWGTTPSADPASIDDCDGLLLWGNNPSASGIHLVPRVTALIERGGWLGVVDPRRTPLARKADLHLQVLPGTDVVVALALAHVAFQEGLADEQGLRAHSDGFDAWFSAVQRWSPEAAARVAGVDVGALRALALGYASRSPALLRAGWGIERNRNGTDAVRAILSLPAVFGKMGPQGGGWALSTSAGYGMALGSIRPKPSGRRTFNMTQLGRILSEASDPPIRLLYVYNCNPVATVPDQDAVRRGLARDDLFTVVHDAFFTDTAAEADLVLPATTFLEHADLTRSYAGYILRWAEPVVAPFGESRSNLDVFRELAGRFGFGDEAPFAWDAAAWGSAIAGTVPGADASLWERLRADRSVAVPPARQVWPPSAPMRLADPMPPVFREVPEDGHLPLTMLSPADRRGINSMMMNDVVAVLRVSPSDASSRGLRHGELVTVFNGRGEVVLPWESSDDLRPGVCEMPKGLWRRASKNTASSVALVPDHVDARGGGACYNDTRVDVRRSPSEHSLV